LRGGPRQAIVAAMKSSFASVLGSLVLACAFAISAPAFADVPPPDACSGGAGTPCNNAGPNDDQPGICTNEMCTHASPDGGTTMEPCVLCEPTDGGAGGAGAGGNAGSSSSSGSASSSSGSASSSSGGGSSCAVGAPGGGSVVALAMAALALGALVRVRRQRR
jgi:MYXO-CTERM domain-containing protein